MHRLKRLNPLTLSTLALIMAHGSHASAYDIPPGYSYTPVNYCDAPLNLAVESDSYCKDSVFGDGQVMLELKRGRKQSGLARGTIPVRLCDFVGEGFYFDKNSRSSYENSGQLKIVGRIQQNSMSCLISSGRVKDETRVLADPDTNAPWKITRNIYHSALEKVPNASDSKIIDSVDSLQVLFTELQVSLPPKTRDTIRYNLDSTYKSSTGTEKRSYISASWTTPKDDSEAPKLEDSVFSFNMSGPNEKPSSGSLNIYPTTLKNGVPAYSIILKIRNGSNTFNLELNGDSCSANSLTMNGEKVHKCREVYFSWMEMFKNSLRKFGYVMTLDTPDIVGGLYGITELLESPVMVTFPKENYSKQVTLPLGALREQIESIK